MCIFNFSDVKSKMEALKYSKDDAFEVQDPLQRLLEPGTTT
eukprot:UN05130